MTWQINQRDILDVTIGIQKNNRPEKAVTKRAPSTVWITVHMP
jgi:hypothetical protein